MRQYWGNTPVVKWVLSFCSVFFWTMIVIHFSTAHAQTESTTQPKSQTVLCGQKVDYSLTPSSEVPTEFRKFLGIWSGYRLGTHAGYNLEYEYCVAFIIKRIDADGTIESIAVGGDTVRIFATGHSFSVKPSVSVWRGKMEGERLRLAGGKYHQELHLSGPNSMEGAYSDPNGAASARLKRQ